MKNKFYLKEFQFFDGEYIGCSLLPSAFNVAISTGCNTEYVDCITLSKHSPVAKSLPHCSHSTQPSVSSKSTPLFICPHKGHSTSFLSILPAPLFFLFCGVFLPLMIIACALDLRPPIHPVPRIRPGIDEPYFFTEQSTAGTDRCSAITAVSIAVQQPVFYCYLSAAFLAVLLLYFRHSSLSSRIVFIASLSRL